MKCYMDLAFDDRAIRTDCQTMTRYLAVLVMDLMMNHLMKKRNHMINLKCFLDWFEKVNLVFLTWIIYTR